MSDSVTRKAIDDAAAIVTAKYEEVPDADVVFTTILAEYRHEMGDDTVAYSADIEKLIRVLVNVACVLRYGAEQQVPGCGPALFDELRLANEMTS